MSLPFATTNDDQIMKCTKRNTSQKPKSAGTSAFVIESMEPRLLLTSVVNTPYGLPIQSDSGFAVTMAGDLAFYYPWHSTAQTGGLFDPFDGSFYPVTLPPEIASAGMYSPNNVATLDGKTYFAGGYTGASKATLTNLVEVFDQSTGVWSQAHLSVARTNVTAVAVGSKVLFAGGTDALERFLSTVDIYDSYTGQWSTAQLSGPADRPNAAVVGTKAYIFTTSEFVDIYDSSNNSWSTTISPLDGGSRVTVIGSKLLVTGYTGGIVGNSWAELFDTTRNKWTTYSNLGSDDFTGAPVGVVGNQVVILGGFFNQTETPNNTTRYFNAKTGKWTREAKLHEGISSVQVGNTLVFTSSTGLSIFNSSSRKWSTVSAGLSNHFKDTSILPPVIQNVDGQVFVFNGSEQINGLGAAPPPIVEDYNFTSPGDDLSPTLSIPGDGGIINRFFPGFGWSSTPGATSYDVLFDGDLIGSTTDNYFGAYYVQAGLASGNHTVQIRAHRANGTTLLGPLSNVTPG